MDDNSGDWTEYIRGTNAALTGRLPGWDMPDHDLAVIDTTSLGLTYGTGLMNICMAVAVNPASGKIAVVGTDGTALLDRSGRRRLLSSGPASGCRAGAVVR